MSNNYNSPGYGGYPNFSGYYHPLPPNMAPLMAPLPMSPPLPHVNYINGVNGGIQQGPSPAPPPLMARPRPPPPVVQQLPLPPPKPRTIIILRGIPPNTSLGEINDLFGKHEDCPKNVSSELAFNDTWYIHFKTEEEAQKAYRFIRFTSMTFKGVPLMARVKSKPSMPMLGVPPAPHRINQGPAGDN